jgi:hypothetical protein
MGHLKQFEEELRSRLEAIQPEAQAEDLIRWLKEEVLGSYRNGLAARGERPVTRRPAARSAEGRPRQAPAPVHEEANG